jgi:hypothetical protein
MSTIRPLIGISCLLSLGSSLIAADHRVAMLDSSLGKSPWAHEASPSPALLPPESHSLPVIVDVTPPRSAGPSVKVMKNSVYVYNDWASSLNHFIPSGWMGDYSDIQLDDRSADDPADGKTCIKITYLARVANGYAWAGMYWQTPENNWGDKIGGYDLSGMRRLTFWARGAKGGETIAEFRIGGIQGDYPDSGLGRIGPVVLSREWRKYQIDLSNVDLTHVVGGFAWSASYAQNPAGLTFYLDEIAYQK